MEKVLSFGSYHISDFLEHDVKESERKYSLDLFLDPSIGAVRLGEVVPSEKMWGQYWYRSGINSSMTKILSGIVHEVTSYVRHEAGDVWLDIACNDGTLLAQVPADMSKVGIDPCNDSYYCESSKVATVVQDYFTYDSWMRAKQSKPTAKVITCIAMFYDLDQPLLFIRDLHKVLADDGVVVLQLSYTPLMLFQMAFDNICHEHVYYHSLSSMTKLFEQCGFKLLDANLNDANGGSVRVYYAKQGVSHSFFATEPQRQVCEFRAHALLEYEKIVDIAKPAVWVEFGQRIEALKEQVVGFIREVRKEGKTVYGYGASTKGNTLLQCFGLTSEDITAIAERAPLKVGKVTVGTRIPIISEEEMRKIKPDYLLVLPWHFIDEFEKREAAYIEGGGILVVPCPTFRLVSKVNK